MSWIKAERLRFRNILKDRFKIHRGGVQRQYDKNCVNDENLKNTTNIKIPLLFL